MKYEYLDILIYKGEKLLGFLVGRFQPFHKGHLATVNEILLDCDKIIIGVGSAQKSFTFSNPLTFRERFLMISMVLSSELLEESRFSIYPIYDMGNNAKWINKIKSKVPCFDVAYTNNMWTEEIFRGAGWEVKNQKIYSPKRYSGTHIRKRILAGKVWRDLVPEPVYQYLTENIKIKNRLTKIVQEENENS